MAAPTQSTARCKPKPPANPLPASTEQAVRGQMGCALCVRSSGAGGGGAAATAGDPWFPSVGGTGSFFAQRAGRGGSGCAGNAGASTRTLAGGVAGASIFRDPTTTNDFWGEAVRTAPRHPAPRRATKPSRRFRRGRRWQSPHRRQLQHGTAWFAEDGGGGGGVLVLQVRGTLTVGTTGRIEANGGSGWGRTSAFVDWVGGGGGGAGGTVVLMAGQAIVLHAHGETFTNRDYDFVLSADGGICRRTSFLVPTITSNTLRTDNSRSAGPTTTPGPWAVSAASA